jgi:Na+-translocating ferredoxin:NAD+ oxidoreductase RnfG subunit
MAYGKGYSSTIETIVGVTTGGSICGIKIVSQKETPGLGAKVQEVASRNTLWAVLSGSAVDETGARPWFEEQYDGLGVEDLRVVKSRSEDGVLAITGATISSEAVTGSVGKGLAMLLGIVGTVEGDRVPPGDISRPGLDDAPEPEDVAPDLADRTMQRAEEEHEGGQP